MNSPIGRNKAMNKTSWFAVALSLGVTVFAGAAFAQDSPLRSTEPVTSLRTLVGYSYPAGVTLEIRLAGNLRIPSAQGNAEIARGRGTTEIEVEVSGLKPASEFGGDFSTYVLWTISPEGQVDNTGEFILRDGRAQLNVSTPLQTFGMMVTAEPHALVSRPSTFVVLENQLRTGASPLTVRPVTLEYRGFEGIYNYYLDSLTEIPIASGEVRSDVKQARMAVILAERAGAREFVLDQLLIAEARLEDLFEAAEQQRPPNVLTTLAQDIIRLGVETEQRAAEARFSAALDAERRSYEQEIQQREAAIREARSEAERSRLEAEQRELELAIEREARDSARNEANAAFLRASAAEANAARAEREREAALDRMRSALDAVAETRVTARGLIVNLPDILFDFNAATLKPEAREVLSRICGILLVIQDYRLEIEGYTDSIGSEDYNQRLSEQRAGTVGSYLAECGLDASRMNSRGFGESYPIASNDTAEGRSQNRRVEIFVPTER
jgi:outer membrane protein OmpA-like peptidoglycan-associated protein